MCVLRIMSCVAALAVPYFSMLSHIRNDILKNCIEHKMCVLIFFTIFVRDISHSMKKSASERNGIINIHRSSCKVPYILMKLEYSRQIFKKVLKYKISIRPVGAELLYIDK